MSESILTEKPRRRTHEEYLEHRRKTIRESQQRRRARAKEQGLCNICASRPVTKGYLTCDECYGRVKIWQAKHKEQSNG